MGCLPSVLRAKGQVTGFPVSSVVVVSMILGATGIIPLYR